MTLSDLVIQYRTEHGLSQRQFALQCGLSNGYISMIEKNRNPNTGLPMVPSLSALNKLAGGMGITLDTLFSLAEDMPVDISASENSSPDPRAAEFAELFSKLSPEQQEFVLAALRGMKDRND